MGFNCLHLSTISGDLIVQFKWGWEEHIDYRLGDTILWYGMPRPDGVEGRVEIPGISDEASDLDHLGLSNLYKIVVLNDVIVGIERVDERTFSALKMKRVATR